jgi:hypothetical protein
MAGDKKYWNIWYVAVVAFLLLQIMVFYYLTKLFA